MQCERHAPNHSAAKLAARQTRIDDPSRSEGADQPGRADLAEVGIDLDLGEHGAMGMHGVGRWRAHIGNASALPLDLGAAGTAKDVRVALAAALVVTPEQAAAARGHTGIAGAE